MSTNGKPTTAFTSETARAAGKASAEARRRKRDLSAEDRALDAIGRRLGDLTNELLDAALGEGDFAAHWVVPPGAREADGLGIESGKPFYVPGLKPETRLTAILRALEWKLGKAPTAKPKVEEDKPEVPTSESLFA